MAQLVPFFSANTYSTPIDMPRAIWDRLLLNSRTYYVSQYVQILIKLRLLIAAGKHELQDVAEQSYNVFKVLEACGGRFHMEGLFNFAGISSPCIFVANHMSPLEANVLPCLILPYMPFTFVIKNSLLRYPVFGPVLAARSPIVVQRQNPRQDFETIIREGLDRLKQGISVVVFPESTRNYIFDGAQFNSIGTKLARKANVPLVPIALKTDFWRNGKFLRDLGPLDRSQPIHLAFGDPMEVGSNTKFVQQQVVEFIRAKVSFWQNSTQ
jgi:1-acyl-sn-glycerol-3-phosphate acyltransferase